MSLRTMLASKAKVGDTIHFSFPNNSRSGKTISAFEVVINGKRIDKPELLTTRGGPTNFVFTASAPGTYQFDITPIMQGEKGERRLNTLEVEI